VSRFPAWYAPGTHLAPGFPVGWDAVEMSGEILNGKALITGGDLSLKVDPRKKKGANSSHPTTHGLDVGEFGLRVCCWTREQMDDVDASIQRYCPPANLDPVTLDHPQLGSIIRLIGKLDVLVTGVTIWQPSTVIARGFEVHFKLLHWPAAAKGASTGKSNTATAPKNALLQAGQAGFGVLARPIEAGGGVLKENPLPTDQQDLWQAPDAVVASSLGAGQ
jgi:hypothetical protein